MFRMPELRSPWKASGCLPRGVLAAFWHSEDCQPAQDTTASLALQRQRAKRDKWHKQILSPPPHAPHLAYTCNTGHNGVFKEVKLLAGFTKEEVDLAIFILWAAALLQEG